MAARRKVKRERVGLIAPTGTRVTVGADSVERFTARGYKTPAKKSTAKPAADDK